MSSSADEEAAANLLAPSSRDVENNKIGTAYEKDGKTSATAQHKFRGDIEAFRGFAVFCVVMYHLYPDSSAGTGVDIFFVLSGFCITIMLRAWTEHNFFSLPYFYACRFRRLLPASTVTIIATVIFASQRFGFRSMQQTLEDADAAATFRINYHFLLQETDYEETLRSSPSPLLHFWSLSVEEQLYLAFPLLIFFMWKAKLTDNTKTIVMIVTTVISLGYSEYLLKNGDDKGCFFGVFGRWWEMSFGYLAEVLHRRVFDKRASMLTKNTASLAATAVLCTTVFTRPSAFKTYPVLQSLPLIAGSALLLAAGGDAIVNEWCANNVFLRWLGKRSYSLYLWHWPIIVIFGFKNQDPGGFVRISVLLLILGWYSERLVERPLRKFGGPVAGLVLGVVCVLCSLLVVALMRQVIQPPNYFGVAAIANNSNLVGALGQHFTLVNLSLATRLVPQNVEPTLRNLNLNDTKDAELLGCANEPKPTDFFLHCTFRESGREVIDSKTFPSLKVNASGIMIAGDSHAENWFRSWQAMARTLNVPITSWCNGGCSIDGLETDEACGRVSDEKMKASLDYNVLVISSGNRGKNGTAMLRAITDIHSDRRAANPNAITVVNGDAHGGTHADMILENGNLDSPRAPYDRVIAVYNEWRELQSKPDFSIRYPGLYFLPTLPLFCLSPKGRIKESANSYDDLQCPSIIGNKLIFIDRHHMTGPMQTYISDIFVDYVNLHHRPVFEALCRATGSLFEDCLDKKMAPYH